MAPVEGAVMDGERIEDVVGPLDDTECAICLEPVQDRCILPNCFHSCLYVLAM